MQAWSSQNLNFKRPELTFRIEKDHFESNFQGQEADFELFAMGVHAMGIHASYYEKIVGEADLDVDFDDDNDRKCYVQIV